MIEDADDLGHWLTTGPVAGEAHPARRMNFGRAVQNVPNIGFESLEEQQRAERAFQSLSAREVTVLAYLSYGLSAKEVALTLNVSSRTVDTFRTRALLKLRARNTADAVRILSALSARAWLRSG